MEQPAELDRSTCYQLLGSARTGRLALNDPEGPQVVPVDHSVVGEDVLIRSGEGRELGATHAGQAASFQVDGVDVAGGRGWSVLARGVLELVDEDEELDRADAPPEPLAGGDRPHLLRLRVRSVTGRGLPALELPASETGNTWFDRDATDLLG